MRPRRWSLALALTGALLLAACGSTGTSPGPAASKNSKFLGCLVTDTGGIDDRSFNASAWQGMKNAHKDLGVTIKYLSSTSQNDYAPNINAFESQKCNLIVTVGFLMGDITKAKAQAAPTQKFAIVDYTYNPPISNVLALIYRTDQDAFLGGYLAAGYSKKGAVGTFGGIQIPTVTIYMDGFAAGVYYYNQKHGTHVKVLGWNPFTQKGSFSGDFTSQDKGRAIATTLMQQGADVIFPVAGNVGLGAAVAVQASGGKAVMEWVDTDGCVSAPQYCSLFLTSVTKGIATSVEAAVRSAVNSTFQGGNYVGTLSNGGVALSPYHDFASKIPSSLQSEISAAKQGIIAGSISVDPKKYPQPAG
ncbi:MAG: BMP family lipoprotein [Candidatus Dormibacteraceae bacterium]